MLQNIAHSRLKTFINYLLLIVLPLTGLGFNASPAGLFSPAAPQALDQACPQPGSLGSLALDGVTLSICFPFTPELVIGAAETDPVQSALAVNRSSGQEMSIYVVPYGLKPASDHLPAAISGGAGLYQTMSFDAYQGEVLAEIKAQPATLFGRQVPGRSVVIPNRIGTPASGQQLITQWAVDAGKRIWLVRLTQNGDSFPSGPGALVVAAQPLRVESANLDQPSISLGLSQQPLGSAQGDMTISAADLPFPSWWSGDCDVNNFPGSIPLGSAYRGVKTCGPLGTSRLVNFGEGVGQYEWQCVEYVKRYMYLAYGIKPYLANGNTVVWNYSGTRLEKVTNGTPNKGPNPGDVISYNGPSTYGHASLVIASSIDASGNGIITIAEQNYSKTGTRTHTVSNWSVISSDGVSGWLHDNQVVNNPPAGFVKCADEGGACKFSGTAQVVYGARDSFTVPRLFNNDVDCNNAVFGDPIGGVTKACYSIASQAGEQTSWSTAYFGGSTHWIDNTNITGQLCTETISSGGLDKDYGTAAPCNDGVADDWVAEYNATLNLAPGSYVFQAQNDDGLKVWVNGQSLMNRAGSTGLSSACPALSLSGSVPVRVILREETGVARVRLLWTTDTSVCNPPGPFGKSGPANGAIGLGIGPALSWSASQGAVNYWYCVDTSNNNLCDNGWQSTGTNTNKVLSGLAYSTKYYWQARSTNSGGEILANAGAWWSFTTRVDPNTCYPLTLTHTGLGNDPSATPSNNPGCTAGYYRSGDVITLTAKPGSGYRVGGWSGTNNNAGTSDTNQLSMPAGVKTASVNYIQAAPLTPATISPTGKVIDDIHPVYKWYASSGAASYLVTLYNEDTAAIVFAYASVPASNCSGSPSICSYHPLVSLGNYNYAFQVAAVNVTGTSPFSVWRSFYMARRKTAFTSMAAQDGFVRESTETSGVGGGLLNNLGQTWVVGDDAQNRQFRSFLSFDTSSLPDNAVILSAVLKLTRQGTVGTNPFTTHGQLLVDIRKPYFGANAGLQIDDFAYPAGLSAAGVVGANPVNGVNTAGLISKAFSQVNLLGLTQLRLRYQLDDDNDYVADYAVFYSADSTMIAYRPILEIEYYTP